MSTGTSVAVRGIDAGAIEAALRPVAGDSVAVLGGPLADGFGDGSGDVPVYIAMPGQPASRPGLAALVGGLGLNGTPAGLGSVRVRVAAGDDRHVEATIVDRAELVHQGSVLRDRCLSAAPGPPLGRPPADLADVLHALYRGNPIWGGDRLEALQTSAGSDFYPVAMGLFAFARAYQAWHDLRRGAGNDPVLGADATRRFTEAVVDAVLAWYGHLNPDPRWRVAGLRRLAQERPGLLPWGRLDAALLGHPADPDLEAHRHTIRTLLDSPLIRTYPEAHRLGAALGEL